MAGKSSKHVRYHIYGELQSQLPACTRQQLDSDSQRHANCTHAGISLRAVRSLKKLELGVGCAALSRLQHVGITRFQLSPGRTNERWRYVRAPLNCVRTHHHLQPNGSWLSGQAAILLLRDALELTQALLVAGRNGLPPSLPPSHPPPLCRTAVGLSHSRRRKPPCRRSGGEVSDTPQDARDCVIRRYYRS